MGTGTPGREGHPKERRWHHLTLCQGCKERGGRRQRPQETGRRQQGPCPGWRWEVWPWPGAPRLPQGPQPDLLCPVPRGGWLGASVCLSSVLRVVLPPSRRRCHGSQAEDQAEPWTSAVTARRPPGSPTAHGGWPFPPLPRLSGGQGSQGMGRGLQHQLGEGQPGAEPQISVWPPAPWLPKVTAPLDPEGSHRGGAGDRAGYPGLRRMPRNGGGWGGHQWVPAAQSRRQRRPFCVWGQGLSWRRPGAGQAVGCQADLPGPRWAAGSERVAARREAAQGSGREQGWRV